MESVAPVHIGSLNARLASGEDSTERLYQLNWCEFIMPTAKESFVTEKGGLFFKATVADLSGQINVLVREQAALGLTGLASKEAFLQEAEDLAVPLVASCRLLMREQGLLVVEASPQDLRCHPTLASGSLSPLLAACPAMPSGFVPAKVENLLASAMYPLAVNQGEKAIACARALVLLISTQKSKLTKCGEAGFFVETQNVSDPYGACGYTTRCLSTMENCVRMRLDPPPGGKVAFFATVSKIEGKQLVLSGVQLLRDGEVALAQESFEKYLEHASALLREAREPKRSLPWAPETARKCRALSRSPTDL